MRQGWAPGPPRPGPTVVIDGQFGRGERRQAGQQDAGRLLFPEWNTRVIAGQIRRARNAALFEIKAATPYPEDYEETVAQAARETKAGYLPPLGHFVADLGQYDQVYLGFPIWGMTAPPVIRSFLRAHDLSGKQVMPFITHGGYGLGNSMDVVASLPPAPASPPPSPWRPIRKDERWNA